MSEASARELRLAGLTLFAVSFVVLFQELALIRWIGAQVRVLAYFPNVVLFSAFLGLGIGALLARRARSLLFAWPPLLLLMIGASVALSRIAFTQEAISEHLWLLYYDLPKNAPVVHGVRLPIVVTFVLSAAAFVPLGQLVGRQLDVFRARGETLTGYSWDLLGSLTGVIAFAIASFAHATPMIWFAAVAVVSMGFLRGVRVVAVAVVSFLALLCIVYVADTADAWSPYYALRKIDLPNREGFLILANGSQHQYAAPSRRADVVTHEDGRVLRTGYHFPYSILARPPVNVLVLGAGSGNDAAVALDEGAQHVDAVEIDPVILELGRRFHPDQPYANGRVRVINDDARSFLNRSGDRYDLVVFGALDSLTRLSALSNVRLDNFVYTRECLAAARRHVAPGGGLVLYFAVPAGYIDDHLRALLTDVFDKPPKVVTFGMHHRLYLSGEAFNRLNVAPAVPTAHVIPSDDWPYLYLRGRSLTPFYVQLIAMFGAIAVLAIGLVARPRENTARIHFDRPMFFFGLAFLLLETKSVTEMNLVWGSTWLTSAVVFGSILLMVLAGTMLMRRRVMPWRWAIAGLMLGLAANYLTPVHALLGSSALVRLLLSMLFVGTPIFFASICFALLFRDEPSTDLAFGWNVLGAVLGGLLEFSSMLIGLKALTLIATGAYVIAVTGQPRRAPLATDSPQ